MEIWNAIKAIKSKAKLAKLEATLESMHMQAAGPKSLGVSMAKEIAAANFKLGGAAYLKDLCLSHANGIVHHASTRQHFTPPSVETLAWGGFMGGEMLTWTDCADADAATRKVLDVIEGART